MDQERTKPAEEAEDGKAQNDPSAEDNSLEALARQEEKTGPEHVGTGDGG